MDSFIDRCWRQLATDQPLKETISVSMVYALDIAFFPKMGLQITDYVSLDHLGCRFEVISGVLVGLQPIPKRVRHIGNTRQDKPDVDQLLVKKIIRFCQPIGTVSR
nr:hypothetical protein [Gimesia panareensis]